MERHAGQPAGDAVEQPRRPAFGRGIAALALYGALSLALLLFGWATAGIGLLFALPWWAASSYAAWKDIFAVDRDH